MARTFLTADSHFGHKSVLSERFDNARPFASIEEHDEALIAAWNAAVRPDDIVWHLGDFAYRCSLGYAAAVLARLNGRKYLIRGNHDHGLSERLSWHGPVLDVARVTIQDPGMTGSRNAWLSHYAHMTWPNAQRGDLHFFGHSHGSLRGMPGSLDVGVDCWNWRPITLGEILPKLAGAAPPRAPEPNR